MNDTVGSGAGLVAQQNLPNLFVSYVRNKIGVKNATFLPGLTGGPVTIPAQTGDVTVAWVSGGATTTNANAEVPSTDIVVGDITLNPNKLGAYVDVGLDLLLMSNPYVTKEVVDSLLAGIVHKLGYTMLKGNASNPTITGLATASGVQTYTIATIASATWANMTGMIGMVDGLEYNGPMEWVMGASDKATFKSIAKGSYGSGFLCEDDRIDGRLVHIDGSLSSGDIFFGDFSNILVGQWGGIELMLDPFTGAKSGKVCVIVRLVCDIGIRRPNTFVKRVAG
jgi:HK97 family phage major capsid protein